MNYRAKRKLNLTLVYVILAILACIWVFPIIWIVLTSFRADSSLTSFQNNSRLIIMPNY